LSSVGRAAAAVSKVYLHGVFGYYAGMAKANNKTFETEESVDDFLNSLADEQQRIDSKAIVEIMRRISGEEPKMWGDAIIGFGLLHLKYASGRELDSPKIGFSPRKTSISLYVTCDAASHAATLAKLGKHKTGKGCIYIKRLADIDLKILEKLVKDSVKQVIRG